jgi:hypothetical protein
MSEVLPTHSINRMYLLEKIYEFQQIGLVLARRRAAHIDLANRAGLGFIAQQTLNRQLSGNGRSRV